ncbi:Sulfotransferase family protein [Sulfitobacter marinus]|uniref:Sulfotransferase family protein n=1 Tax=Sulfitobacter marinus TaxID=394264 RepID=A0A1I6T9K6_9RHOB|nr:sulfotransferase [Sulfitobacter marinus]SFS85884.1 Sulfotransferase family protein [Sulfitobacter marinus]
MPNPAFPSTATMVFCIGAQKAGTTWLYDALRCSDQIHFSRNKELHYFDVIAGKGQQMLDMRVQAATIIAKRLIPQLGNRNCANLRQLRDLTDLLGIYTCEPNDHSAYLEYLLEHYKDQQVVCDITPAYAILDRETFAQMGQIGSAKFIFILRDPVTRMWSQIRMAIKAASPPATSFQDACIARAQHLIQSGRLPKIERADYKRTIVELEEAIPPDRIKYVFYEDMFNPASMNSLCGFLGIGPIEIEPQNHSNIGTSAAMPAEIRADFCNAFATQYDYIHGRFGGMVPDSWAAECRPDTSVNRTG